MKHKGIINLSLVTLVGLAYAAGRRNGWNAGVLKCKEILVNTIIDKEDKKES